MQFKNPELLWALILLLIPILVHLFQLRRFKKTPFTNVQFLQKVVSQSRKSSTLKKWLLLVSRLLLLTALIIAFTQPFLTKSDNLQERETVIYLDNSFSLQAKEDGESLLKSSIQELLKSIPKNKPYTLFTNDKVFRNKELKDLQNELLGLEHSEEQLNIDDIYLKGSTFFDGSSPAIKNLVLISDFQESMASKMKDTQPSFERHLVQLEAGNIENVSIDSIFIASSSPDNIELEALLTANTVVGNVPVSLYNSDKLIAKTSAQFVNQKASVVFTFPYNLELNGTLEITDSGLGYDNQLYFNIAPKEKIRILAINGSEGNFLTRIFTDDEFNYSAAPVERLDYSAIDTQNMIILNGLDEIPTSLIVVLQKFQENGGSLVIIPSENANIDAYNNLLNRSTKTVLTKKIRGDREITSINFSHPLYLNVFDKKVVNFQYPKVSEYYTLDTEIPQILNYDNGAPFLIGSSSLYIFTAPLSLDVSNFKNSPLIVPTLYTMGINSLKIPNLYEVIGRGNTIDLPIGLGKDEIMKLSQNGYEVIPEQKSFTNKTTLNFKEVPDRAGLFTIKDKNRVLRNISFNFPRNESELRFLNVADLNPSSTPKTISSVFEALEKENRITELWKWFIILALLFVFLEVLIQKIFK